MNSKFEETYIVGGGSSLKGFDFSRLENKCTIVVNMALKVVPKPNVFLTADSWFCGHAVRNDFWNKMAYRVMVIAPTHKNYGRAKPYLAHYDEVIAPFSYDGDISLDPDKFATGRNSGFCAFQYTILKKPKRIYLLGFDFHRHGGDHWHDDYPVGYNRLKEFAGNFITAIKKLKKIAPNIEVISCSSDSLLRNHTSYCPLENI